MDNKTESAAPLPRHTVRYVTDPRAMSEAALQGMLSNPVYVGVPPYRRVVSDDAWIRAAKQLIEKDGVEQFLVNMLYMLRISMVDAVPDEAIPEDYDGPWPEDEEEELLADEENGETFLSPWRNPVEGNIYCSHDDMPMILIDDEFVCVAEYLYAHIDNAPVNDLLTHPTLTLVFQNGHTLPLLCPSCGDSVHVEDSSQLLDNLNGLTVVDMEWDADAEELLVHFGHPEEDEEEEIDVLETVALHLDSVRGITCPHKKAWHDEDEED